LVRERTPLVSAADAFITITCSSESSREQDRSSCCFSGCDASCQCASLAHLCRLRHCRSRSWPGLRMRSAIAATRVTTCSHDVSNVQNFVYSYALAAADAHFERERRRARQREEREREGELLRLTGTLRLLQVYSERLRSSKAGSINTLLKRGPLG